MSLSGHWWESSSPLLTLVSTVAGIVAVVAAVWAALYASRPRRGLAYSAKIRFPTANDLAEFPDDVISDQIKQRAIISIPRNEEQRAVLKKTLQEDPSQRPVVVTFTLRGTGRLDVPTSAFDNGTPITLSIIDAEIRGAFSTSTRGGGGLAIAQQVDNSEFKIGPGLIGRNQILTYKLAVITKGRMKLHGKPRITLTNALIDTRLRTDKRQIFIGVTTAIAACGILFGVWDVWLRHISAISGIASRISSIGSFVVAIIFILTASRNSPAKKPRDNIEITIKPQEVAPNEKSNPDEK